MLRNLYRASGSKYSLVLLRHVLTTTFLESLTNGHRGPLIKNVEQADFKQPGEAVESCQGWAWEHARSNVVETDSRSVHLVQVLCSLLACKKALLKARLVRLRWGRKVKALRQPWSLR